MSNSTGALQVQKNVGVLEIAIHAVSETWGKRVLR